MKLPKNNAYQCEYGCLMVTVDVDEGVTPFMIKCRTKQRPDRPLNKNLTDENGECKGIAKSCFYPKMPMPKHYKPPQWEWAKPEPKDLEDAAQRYKVSVEEVKKEYAKQPDLLILRERTDREPVYHD